MIINRLSPSWRSCVAFLGLSVTITLAGCTSMVNVPAPDTTPIQAPHSTSTDNQASDADGFTQTQ